MQINGFNDFQQLRRAPGGGKEDLKAAANRAYAGAGAGAGAGESAEASEKSAVQGDAVSISPMARNLARLRQTPDTRAGLVEEMKTRLENGELDSPEATERGVAKMLNALFGNEF